MSDENTQVQGAGEITEADYIMAAVLPRTTSLMDMLEDRFDMSCQLFMGNNGLPRIQATYQDETVRFAYLHVGDSDTNRFILVVTADAYYVDEDDENGMGMVFECEGFNVGSTFGYAIYNPEDRVVTLRATIPELGGMPEAEWFEHCLGLFWGSFLDLQEILSEEEK